MALGAHDEDERAHAARRSRAARRRAPRRPRARRRAPAPTRSPRPAATRGDDRHAQGAPRRGAQRAGREGRRAAGRQRRRRRRRTPRRSGRSRRRSRGPGCRRGGGRGRKKKRKRRISLKVKRGEARVRWGAAREPRCPVSRGDPKGASRTRGETAVTPWRRRAAAGVARRRSPSPLTLLRKSSCSSDISSRTNTSSSAHSRVESLLDHPLPLEEHAVACGDRADGGGDARIRRRLDAGHAAEV